MQLWQKSMIAATAAAAAAAWLDSTESLPGHLIEARPGSCLASPRENQVVKEQQSIKCCHGHVVLGCPTNGSLGELDGFGSSMVYHDNLTSAMVWGRHRAHVLKLAVWVWSLRTHWRRESGDLPIGSIFICRCHPARYDFKISIFFCNASDLVQPLSNSHESLPSPIEST